MPPVQNDHLGMYVLNYISSLAIKLLIDGFTNQLKSVRDLVERLRVPDKKVGLLTHIFVKSPKKYALCIFIKIDHHVATKDDIEMTLPRPSV